MGSTQMWVGMLRLELFLPQSASLKDKRRAVSSLKERVRGRFGAAVAEVEALDEHRRAILGVAVVGNDQRELQSQLDQICHFIEDTHLGVPGGKRQRLEPFGEHSLLT